MDMWKHAKVMTEARPGILPFGFSGNPAHPSKICQVPIELWREKTMYMHGVDCPRILLLLGQEGARMPRHGNLPVEQSQHVASPKKKIEKECT